MPPPAVATEADSGRSDCLWAAKVKLKPYSESALVRFFLMILELVNFLFGNRIKGEIIEFEEQICIRTKEWSFWVFQRGESTTWIKKPCITGAGSIARRGFLNTHRFVHLDYPDGHLSKKLLWIKGCNAEEISHVVERWVCRA